MEERAATARGGARLPKESPGKGEEMNKGRLIGGIVCLAIAGLLAALVFALPQGEFIFMIGERNMPWVPVVVLAGIGAALVSMAPWQQGA